MADHTTQTQDPPAAAPDPALRRLDALVGSWEMSGHTLGAAGDNISGWAKFEWLPGGFFLKQTGEIHFNGALVQSTEIIGYDPASGTFESRVFSNLSGDIVTYHWDVQGDTVTHWEDTSKYTGTLGADGRTLTGGWRPNAGQPVETLPVDEGNAYDVIMRRVD